MKRFLLSGFTLTLIASAGCGATPETMASTTAAATTALTPQYNVPTGSIADALAGAHRSDADKARDGARHPIQTLNFFQLKPTDHVIEMWPGRGWYTKVLTPVVKGQGKLTLALTDPESEGYRGTLAKDMMKDLAAHPELYSEVDHVVFSPPSKLNLGPANSADLVVTFRSTHNWAQEDSWRSVKRNYQAIFDVLKPGGRLGIVQHRDVPSRVDYEFKDSPPVATKEMGLMIAVPKVVNADTVDGQRGYIPEGWVIQILRNVGFTCTSSDINANPKDTKNHANGVWSLPPSMKGGDTDRAKYEAIGESDRMTLLCIKPE